MDITRKLTCSRSWKNNKTSYQKQIKIYAKHQNLYKTCLKFHKFDAKDEEILLNFFFLLIDKNRIENTRDIGEVFAELVEADKGKAQNMVKQQTLLQT